MGKLQKDSFLATKHTIVFEKKIIIKLSSFLSCKTYNGDISYTTHYIQF